MTPRERFLANMRFDPSVSALKAEYGYWTTAMKRFISEGLPVTEALPEDLKDNGTISGGEKIDPSGNTVIDKNVREHLHLDPYPSKFPFDLSPLWDVEILEDQKEYRIIIDSYGITKKERKTGTSAPFDIEFPIKNRKNFEAYKEHYDKDFSRRLPSGWNVLKETLKNRDFAVRLGGFPFGFFGFPRHLIGTEELFLMMYDEPRLIKDINEFFLSYVMEYWAEILQKIKPDCVLIWEDMASKTGSLISKEMFKEFMSPYYVRIIDYFRQFDITNIHVDSDGYIEDLLPLWVELGVTGLFPFERQAGNDVLAIRERYPDFQMLGSVDKRVFTANRSKADIDEELELIGKLLQSGGYIPHADHHVPDDSCWENFRYYRSRLNDIIDLYSKGGE